MMDFERIVYTSTALVLGELTDKEAIAFNMFLLLGGGDPKRNLAWPKVEPLFTQRLTDGSIAMHPDTLRMAEAYLDRRISELDKGE